MKKRYNWLRAHAAAWAWHYASLLDGISPSCRFTITSHLLSTLNSLLSSNFAYLIPYSNGGVVESIAPIGKQFLNFKDRQNDFCDSYSKCSLRPITYSLLSLRITIVSACPQNYLLFNQMLSCYEWAVPVLTSSIFIELI